MNGGTDHLADHTSRVGVELAQVEIAELSEVRLPMVETWLAPVSHEDAEGTLVGRLRKPVASPEQQSHRTTPQGYPHRPAPHRPP